MAAGLVQDLHTTSRPVLFQKIKKKKTFKGEMQKVDRLISEVNESFKLHEKFFIVSFKIIQRWRTIFWLVCLNVVRVGRFAHNSQQFD